MKENLKKGENVKSVKVRVINDWSVTGCYTVCEKIKYKHILFVEQREALLDYLYYRIVPFIYVIYASFIATVEMVQLLVYLFVLGNCFILVRGVVNPGPISWKHSA